MKVYIGIKRNAKPAIFESETDPNQEAKPEYEIIYGPFNSREDAEKYVNAMGALACGEG